MNVSAADLESKIRDIYPEIDRFGLSLSVTRDAASEAWLVRIFHENHELTTHVEDLDARNCLEGVECVHLGSQIGQFARNSCLKEKECAF